MEPTYRVQSQNHVVNLVRIERIGITPFTDKVYQLDAYNSRPHGHWRNLPEPKTRDIYRSALLTSCSATCYLAAATLLVSCGVDSAWE